MHIIESHRVNVENKQRKEGGKLRKHKKDNSMVSYGAWTVRCQHWLMISGNMRMCIEVSHNSDCCDYNRILINWIWIGSWTTSKSDPYLIWTIRFCLTLLWKRMKRRNTDIHKKLLTNTLMHFEPKFLSLCNCFLCFVCSFAHILMFTFSLISLIFSPHFGKLFLSLQDVFKESRSNDHVDAKNVTETHVSYKKLPFGRKVYAFNPASGPTWYGDQRREQNTRTHTPVYPSIHSCMLPRSSSLTDILSDCSAVSELSKSAENKCFFFRFITYWL